MFGCPVHLVNVASVPAFRRSKSLAVGSIVPTLSRKCRERMGTLFVAMSAGRRPGHPQFGELKIKPASEARAPGYPNNYQ